METEIKHNRFKDAEWFGENKVILIGGVGGTGSTLAILLSRSGDHELHIYDDDRFEEHNMAGQFVHYRQIGLSKVSALVGNIESFSNVTDCIYSYNQKYAEDTMSNEIVFSCFDNMKARKDMFTNWKKLLDSDMENASKYLYVDLRLLAESMTIFFVCGDKPAQIEKYQSEELFDDSEVMDVDCTLKQTTHAAFLIASMTVGFFTNWLANGKIGAYYRKVPYRTDYMISLNLFENEYI